MTNPDAAASAAGADLARRLGCLACHRIESRLVGPAFREIARRYGGGGSRTGAAGSEAHLVAKLKTGGVGVWGQVPLPGQSRVGAADARAIVAWILAGAR